MSKRAQRIRGEVVDESTPARDGARVPTEKLRTMIQAAKADAICRGLDVVRDSGFKRLRDGSVRIHLHVQQAPQKERA